MANPKPSEQDAAPVISEMADLLAQQKLVHPSGIEGLIFGLWG
jgi:hypothetical protein